ncbi:hypothetical protein JAAARDRAFT_149198 [Jaapia argillacea MUCL 33604]|uniref:Pet127-domain-containing protein n=1 Tax=Jaapia argillacea MUCL 33604 TaxID=933084 RepID=A0A067Q5V4_9AGAM|nr:hypothetical protein JAAARDRAFT_149198 [Jaapia argillacea MUCL 33604]
MHVLKHARPHLSSGLRAAPRLRSPLSQLALELQPTSSAQDEQPQAEATQPQALHALQLQRFLGSPDVHSAAPPEASNPAPEQTGSPPHSSIEVPLEATHEDARDLKARSEELWRRLFASSSEQSSEAQADVAEQKRDSSPTPTPQGTKQGKKKKKNDPCPTPRETKQEKQAKRKQKNEKQKARKRAANSGGEYDSVIAASVSATARGSRNSGRVVETLRDAILSAPDSGSGKDRLVSSRRVSHRFTWPSNSETPLHRAASQSSSRPPQGWTGTEWKEDWGTDNLAPPATTDGAETSQEPGLPHIKKLNPPHRPIPYTRRVEGLLEHTTRKSVLEDVDSPSEHREIARLDHGLDRVLFNPGVHWLQDPRSQVYNYSPWLQKIPNVSEFAFERIVGFIKSSEDTDLYTLAKRENRTFVGSTSSLTGLMSHIYFLISGDRDVDLSSLSRNFALEPSSFTPGQRMPVSVRLNYKDGVYAFDSTSDVPGASEKNILTWLGTMLEKFLTTSPEEFTKLLRSTPATEVDSDPRREAYRYAKSPNFIMRSQLDCVDPRLPGTGVFDLKTRSAISIRMDTLNYEESSGYMIKSLQGPMESFEKEYYDLIRSAFLKYSFQARIGNMDGILIAYHNTARIFGFQYVPLAEMDERLFGGEGRGDRVFDKCVSLLEVLASEIIQCFPGQSVQCMAETREGKGVMNVFVEPVEWNEEEQGPRPIIQLDLTSTSYLDNQEVRGPRAVSALELPWSIHWSISRSAKYEDEIRQNHIAARERQFRAWALPTGVTIEEMEERWKQMNFGGKKPEEIIEAVNDFDPTRFRDPTALVEGLRRLSREGRRHLAEMEGIEDEITSDDPDSSLVVDESQSLSLSLDVDPSSVLSAPCQDGQAFDNYVEGHLPEFHPAAEGEFSGDGDILTAAQFQETPLTTRPPATSESPDALEDLVPPTNDFASPQSSDSSRTDSISQTIDPTDARAMMDHSDTRLDSDVAVRSSPSLSTTVDVEVGLYH